MYVARNTFTPEYDTERNWSAWIGNAWESQEEGIIDQLEVAGIDSEELESRWERWQDAEHNTWHHRDTESYIDFLSDLASDNGIDIRFNEKYGKWQLVHHEGLSCYRLEAESLEEAVAEAKAGEFPWHGFGDMTIGTVKYVASVTDTLHIFECDDACVEI